MFHVKRLRIHYNNLHQRTAQARENLRMIQESLRTNPGDTLLKHQETTALSVFIRMSRAEESLYRQKSRIAWLVEGDNNTSYFHNCVKERTNRNKILSLCRDDNTVVYEVPQIQQEATSYFYKLFNQEGCLEESLLPICGGRTWS